ncbi:MAG: DNA sulfur modification protein DndB [Spirulina sp.]
MTAILKIQAPAIQGKQGDRECFTAHFPFPLFAQTFSLFDKDLPPQKRAQRKPESKRAESIKKYMVARQADYVIPNVTVATVDKRSRRGVNFISAKDELMQRLEESGAEIPKSSIDLIFENKEELGTIYIDNGTNVHIIDGQHRHLGIQLLIDSIKEIEEEEVLDNWLNWLEEQVVSVTFYLCSSIEEAQTIFRDINANAIGISKSLNVAYDRTNQDWLNIESVLKQCVYLNGLTDFEGKSLLAKSHYLFLLVNLKEAIKESFKGVSDTELAIKLSVEYWQSLTSAIAYWSDVWEACVKAKTEEEKKTLLEQVKTCRKENIAHKLGVLRAFGKLGRLICGAHSLAPEKYSIPEIVSKLEGIDWSIDNEDWLLRCVSPEGKTLTRAQYSHNMLRYFKLKCGIELDEEEQKLEEQLERDRAPYFAQQIPLIEPEKEQKAA